MTQAALTATPARLAETISAPDEIAFWMYEDGLPRQVVAQFGVFFPQLEQAETEEDAQLKLGVLPSGSDSGTSILCSRWVYILVAPFPTIEDNIRLDDLKKVWRGEAVASFGGKSLVVSQQTKAAFTQMWGRPSERMVSILGEEQLLSNAWQQPYSWAIIPFEQLQPRWKLIQVDGMSPLDRVFDADQYGLTVKYVLTGEQEAINTLRSQITGEVLPITNFDMQKLTMLIMTGTTAMARHLAFQMEEKGVLYPAEQIGQLLAEADITHISNEVSFDKNCPPAVPLRREARFCSDPKYFELLTHIGADVIELTGNHNLDWGYEPFLFSLELYRENGMPYYGGGKDAEDAKKALLLQHHGNKLAFLGCSQAGPENVWATRQTPGSARCDFDWIQQEIARLTNEGYLPIFTFQHFEVDDVVPHSLQRVDFQNVAHMGAVIVSGSQSHFAQSMTFVGNHFVHYGLGNLFFDQMEEINRRAFIDRHFIYDGHYINTQLIPIILEDYAQPRLLSEEERSAFLSDIFTASKW
ncbi:MAG: hypothetical protein HPY45_06605 [Anaerolineae bacterium]|nr:hypothetical protein [Anaerolineae bacterium]